HQQVNVAHDLRTPMAAIRGYARMVLDGRAGEVNDTQKEYLRIIAENTNRLISLVGWMNYTAEGRVESLKLSTFGFCEIWNDCVGRCEQTLAEKSVKLLQQIADESFTIVGDIEKLNYAMKDLIVVAVRLTASGGTITVDISHGRERELIFKLSIKGG